MPEPKEKKEKREQYKITIGSKLKKILDAQKENMIKVCFGCLKPSDYDAGEIIAEKIMERGGIKTCKRNMV